MVRVEAREMLSGVIVLIRCYHGWADHSGHTLHTEVVDVDGEDSEQLVVAAADALNHWLKDRSKDICASTERVPAGQP